ncbi:Intramolecular chaperone auto-processing domain containing protein [uncultured Caudovirales phage]|uniref:Intramolecular chaperone auto-processing domain containing protein n=1 Tax=uncultured Caudovirales phage TaxID=2100421 RepID=A0A6J7X122_9CAUD|nr:Intramolecular chaperone auto-processing domain containing protein [uncultured Caudovirales phage]
MANTKISEFSSTPGNNTDIDGINIAEGCAPSGINNAIRELMAQLKDFQAGTAGDSFNGPIGTTTAAAGAFTTLSATGVSTFQAGTVSAPAITTSGDTNTGIFFPAADTIAFTKGGVEAMRLDSSGNMGIGTTSPAYKLDVRNGSLVAGNGTITGGISYSTRVEMGAISNHNLGFTVNNTTQMLLDTGGNLGIGTTSPAYKLVVSAAGASGIEFGPAYSGTANLIQSYNRSGGAYVNTVYDAANHAYNISGTERMRLDSSGNLGIGTSSPSYKLDVLASAGPYVARFGNSSTATNQYNVILLTQGAAGSATGYIGTGGSAVGNTAFANTFVVGTQTSSSLVFNTADTERARLTDAGAFLIGTTTRYFGENLGVYSSSSYTITSTRTGTGNEGHMAFQNANGTVGTIFTNGTTTAYNTSSDYRLKNITGPITTSGAYIDSLNPVEGTWKADGSTFVGLIAHEVQEASRTTVATGTKDGEQMQGMDYSSAEIIANLIAEVKSLRARVAALEFN